MKKRCGAQGANRLMGYQAITLGAMLSVSVSPIHAEGVFLVQEKPEPEALLQMLYPAQQAGQQAAPQYKLRGIRFTEESRTIDGEKNDEQNDDQNGSHNSTASGSSGTAVGFNIQFAHNSPALSPETLPYLDAVGEMLSLEQAQDAKLAIVGHADASGDSTYNLTLSQARAAAVARYIETKFAVAGDRITTRGYGESSPLPNADPYDAMNRRVEFHPIP